MAGGADGILGNSLQAAIDKFTRVVDRLYDAVSSQAAAQSAPTGAIPVPPPAQPIPQQSYGMHRGNAGWGTTEGGGFTTAGVAGTVAAGIGGAGSSGMIGGLARTALGYAPAPVASAVMGLAAAGSASQPAQIALNTLQYQSSLFGQSYNTTRMGAMGTAGTVLGGQVQNQFGLNPQDMATGYASLQQATAQLNPYGSGLGAQNVIGTMGGMNIANPALGEAQNAAAVQQFYNPQTSMNMAMLGLPGPTPDQEGTGAHIGTFADTGAALLGRLGGGKALTQQQLQSQLSEGQKGYIDLSQITGGNPATTSQFASELSIQNALMIGQNNQPKMTLEQVNRLFAALGSQDPQTFNGAEAVLQQYGINQAAIQTLKSKAGNQAQSVSDQSQGFMAGMKDMTRAMSDFNTGLNKVINSVPGARGILGWGESVMANIIGGGSQTMYDSTEPNDSPTTPQSGMSSPLMIAYYPYTEGQPDKSKFPSGTQFVTIDNDGSHTDCDVVDFEAGAVYPASAVVAWLKKAGGNKVVYSDTSNKPALDAANPPKYSWWSAEWTNSPHVTSGAVATQYKSTSTYDISEVSDAGAFNGQPGTGGTPAGSPTSGTSTTTTTTTAPAGLGGLSAGLGDYATEGSTEEISAFNAAIMGGALGGGGAGGTSTSTTTTTPGSGGSPTSTPASGGKTMYDTQYPSIVPSSADLVVSYVDGPQASNYNQAVSIFGSKALSITWTGQNADIADVESSAVSTSQLPAWIDAQVARGIPKPVVYAIYSGIGTNYQQVKQAVGTKSVSFWLSDWTGKPHTLPGADAVQYGAQASPSSPMITDPGQAGGKTYDLSFVSPSFPYYGGAPTLKPPAGHSGQEQPKFTYTPPIPSTAGITIHFPAGSITAADPAKAATKAVAQLRAELVRLNLVSN
jgi:hypothetical protein